MAGFRGKVEGHWSQVAFCLDDTTKFGATSKSKSWYFQRPSSMWNRLTLRKWTCFLGRDHIKRTGLFSNHHFCWGYVSCLGQYLYHMLSCGGWNPKTSSTHRKTRWWNFKYLFIFTPKIGEDFHPFWRSLYIVHMGWNFNHQLENAHESIGGSYMPTPNKT